MLFSLQCIWYRENTTFHTQVSVVISTIGNRIVIFCCYLSAHMFAFLRFQSPLIWFQILALPWSGSRWCSRQAYCVTCKLCVRFIGICRGKSFKGEQNSQLPSLLTLGALSGFYPYFFKMKGINNQARAKKRRKKKRICNKGEGGLMRVKQSQLHAEDGG